MRRLILFWYHFKLGTLSGNTDHNEPLFMHNLEFSGRAITSLQLVESDKSTNCRSSGEKCSWEPSEITNGTPAESSYDSLNRNRFEEIDRHQLCHSPRSHVKLKRCSTARVDHIFGLSPFDTNGKPPLAPGRHHKARLNGSKSSG